MLQQRLRRAEEKNEETFNGFIRSLAEEMEKPPKERRVRRDVYEEVLKLHREIETANRICTMIDQQTQERLKKWLEE